MKNVFQEGLSKYKCKIIVRAHIYKRSGEFYLNGYIRIEQYTLCRNICRQNTSDNDIYIYYYQCGYKQKSHVVY